MNLKTNKIFISLLFCLTMLLIFSLRVNAANATIELDKSNVELGKSVKITVSGEGVQWNLKLKVDGETLKTDSELENYEANKKISFSATYTPKTTGVKNVTLEGSVTEFSDGSTKKSFASKSITVEEVKQQEKPNEQETPTTPSTPSTPTDPSTPTEQPKEKSKDANLSTLGVTPKEYDFSGFSKNKTSYSVTIPSDVDSLKVLYKTVDSNAKVKITGNSGFEVGSDNEIKIVVTAEDGKTTKTYTIKVTKLAEEEEKPGNLIENEEGIYLTSLKLEGIEISPEFAKDIYSYTATLTNSSATNVNVKAIANNEDAKVEISGNTDLVEGENTINIVVTIEGSAEQKVYQIVVTKESVAEDTTGVLDDSPNTGTDLIGTIKDYATIAIAVVVLMIVAVIILIILLRRENKRLNEEDDEVDKTEKETLEEINKETERIFSPKVEEKPEEYLSEEPRGRRSRRERGKHSK